VQLDFAVLPTLRRSPAPPAESIGDLAQVRDAGSGWHDPLPTLYSALAMCHSAEQSFREHTGHVAAMIGDMNWTASHRRNVGGRRNAAHQPAPSAG